MEKGVEFNPLPETFENPTGNPVLHGSSVYLVYWDPSNRYHNDWKALIDHFLENVNQAENSGGDVFAVDEQYTDTTNQPAYNRLDYRGSATDTTPYPSRGMHRPRPPERLTNSPKSAPSPASPRLRSRLTSKPTSQRTNSRRG